MYIRTVEVNVSSKLVKDIDLQLLVWSQVNSELLTFAMISTSLLEVDKQSAVAISIRQLNYYYGNGNLRKQALFDISLDIQAGEIVILTGPSGSGKTTLLSIAGALRSAQEGSLLMLGENLIGMGEMQLMKVRQRIGFIFQSHNLFQSLTACQNVKMALEMWHLPFNEVESRAIAILEQLGLEQRIHYKPDSLSGGQKQRVAIARALVNRPQIILADEPTAALDKNSGRDVVNLMRELAAEGKTILMVTHDNRIFDVADRIIHMVDGRLAD